MQKPFPFIAKFLCFPHSIFMKSSANCLLRVFVAVSLITAVSSFADTILQTNAQGERVVVQTSAIVIRQDSNNIVFKHFDLKQRLVEKEQLNQGSLPYEVVRTSPEGRQQIVNIWKRFGYTATVVDQSGKTARVYDAYLDFFPGPGVSSFLESVPPRTNLPILFDGGGADEIEFSDIARIEIQGDHLKLTLTNGRIRTGKLLMPTREPAIAHFMGITDHYSPASENTYDFSLPLSQIKEVRFEEQ